MPPQYYQGVAPTNCEHCGNQTRAVFSDIKTLAGAWANLCDACVANITSGKYGTGLGQRYIRQTNGKWMKVAG